MMGPEHYKEAERLLRGPWLYSRGTETDETREDVHDAPSDRDIAAAQVHATLALAAATAGKYNYGMSS